MTLKFKTQLKIHYQLYHVLSATVEQKESEKKFKLHA